MHAQYSSMSEYLCVQVTGFSPDSSAPCRAVTALSTISGRSTGIRKNNVKQFENRVSKRKARD